MTNLLTFLLFFQNHLLFATQYLVTINKNYKEKSINLPHLLSEVPTVSYRITGCHGSPACTRVNQFTGPSDSVSLLENNIYQIHVCVNELLHGKITVNNVINQNECTATKQVFSTQRAGSDMEVNIMYTEDGGCKRSGRFTINISGKYLLLVMFTVWVRYGGRGHVHVGRWVQEKWMFYN